MVTGPWAYVQVTLFKQSVEDELAAYRLGYDMMHTLANIRMHASMHTYELSNH